MGDPPRSDAKSSAGKRSRSKAPDDALSSKKLLANNRYAVLENGDEPKVEEKQKMPPLYVKGFPEGLLDKIYFFINKGLRCTIRLCSEGYKIMVSALNHYNAVKELLQREKVEYFSHDIATMKPFKIVLRGLPEMEVKDLAEELKRNGLKPIQINKMRRHDSTRKFRDQLYQIHFEKNSTNIKDLQNIRALFHIVVKWDSYRPIHRDVTQCMNCLKHGHGTKNCHMQKRCINCGKHHDEACELMEDADPVCANCGAAHKATSKECPKRSEYIEIRRRASTNNQPGRRRQSRPPPDLSDANFPALQPNGPPVSQPGLSWHSAQPRLAAAAALPNERNAPGVSFSRVTSGSNDNDPLLTTEEIIAILSQATIIKRSCRTRNEQIQAMITFINGP